MLAVAHRQEAGRGGAGPTVIPCEITGDRTE